MLQTIRGTTLTIEDGVVKDEEGKPLSGKVNTTWCGEEKTLDVEWLKQMHRFRIYNEHDIEISKQLINVRFVKHNRDIEDDGIEAYTIYSAKPIKVGEYRVIARYPRYAINQNGDVLKLKNGSVRRKNYVLSKYEKYKEHNKYPFIYLFDSRLGISTKVYLHILLGTTWIENDDWNNYILNHIDHDKMNVTLENLEWVSSSENTLKYYQYKSEIMKQSLS